MSRTAGARNRDYDATRDSLSARMADHLANRALATPPTITEMATAAGVSPPTLRHYFGDADGAVAAAIERTGRESAPHLDAAADPGGMGVEQSLRSLLALTVRSWRDHGVGDVVTAGLSLGLSRPALGPVHLTHQLDPLIQAAARRLDAHVARGELPAMDTRGAALSLLAPVVLALLHQDRLGGATSHPMDVEALGDRHARVMLAGWQALGSTPVGE